MPNNSATAMVQTQDGYLWFGTFHGLVRFDGVRCTVFDSSNTPELPNDAIINLHVDRHGALWCSTRNEMARRSEGRWKRFTKEDGWSSDYARSFAESPNGPLYVTGFDGKIFRFHDERFEAMPQAPGDPTHGYFCHVDPDGFFWVSQNRFTGFWDGMSWQRVIPEARPDQTEFGAGPARDGALWVVQHDLLQKITRTGVTKETKLAQEIRKFWNLTELSGGDLAISSYSEGVYLVGGTGSVAHITMAGGLPHDGVRFVFEDRESNYWIGTTAGGLMRVKPRTFRNYSTESGLAERVVKSVVVRPTGEVLIGTHGKGIARLDPRPFGETATPLELPHPGFIQSLLEDRAGNVWLGTYHDGLQKLTADGAERIGDSDSAEENVAALFEDSRSRLWIAFTGNVHVRDGTAFTPVGQNGDGNALAGVRAFEEEPASGAILAANERGLFRFEKDSFVEVKDWNGHSIDHIFCIKALPDGSIWLGTANRGLLRLRGGTLSPIGEAQGLPIQTVSSILDDHLGSWWLSSSRGIVRVNARHLEAAANGEGLPLRHNWFTVSDGLGSIECPSGFQPTAARGPDGRLWFATLKGVSVVDPRGMRINARPPPVMIESASFVDGKRRPQKLFFAEPRPITLPAGSSQLDVHFTGLSFTAPEKMKFAYKLKHDEELVASEEMSSRVVSFNLLPPGNYKLQVTASNNDGVWNREGAVLAFTVLPFFWQTPWFRFGAFAALAGSFGAFFWGASERRVQIQREKFEHQKALADQKARLASVLEGTSDLVGFASPQGKILYLNSAGRKLLKLGRDEDVSRLDIRDFYSESARDVLRETALPTAIRDGTWSGEAVMHPNEGPEILTSQVLLAHKDEQNRVLFLSAIIRDITESRKMEEQLRHAQKMEALGTLASGIAHDFNNVLSAIIGNVELARVDVGPNHHALESLNEVRKASIRARDLVQQILAFSRQQVHDRKAISLVPVVGEAARLLRATLPAGIELVTAISAETPNVLADASQIHQVVLNLCTNAWHAVPEGGGRIEIQLDPAHLQENSTSPDLPPGAYARLTVRDNGVGMDAATLEHIFEPFFTTKTRGRGTGLGLAVVHGIVNNHQGAITVTSQPGVGTTFQLFFPATTEIPESSVSDQERPIPPNGRGEHILYLDDEAPLVSLASRALEKIGYRVTGFTQPNEALAAFRKDPSQFDVVVTDFNMPGMSGLDMAHIFLSLRPDLPVLLTSGYLSDELKTNARAAGVSALIYKPNTVVELREAIHRWVGANKLGPK